MRLLQRLLKYVAERISLLPKLQIHQQTEQIVLVQRREIVVRRIVVRHKERRRIRRLTKKDEPRRFIVGRVRERLEQVQEQQKQNVGEHLGVERPLKQTAQDALYRSEIAARVHVQRR